MICKDLLLSFVNIFLFCCFFVLFLSLKVKSLSHVWLFATPWTVTWLLCPWDFPGNSTGVDCHFLLCVNLFYFLLSRSSESLSLSQRLSSASLLSCSILTPSSLTAGRTAAYLLGSGTKLRQVYSCYLQVVSCTDKSISRSVVAGNSLPKMAWPNLEALALGIVKLGTVLDMWVKTELEGSYRAQASWWWSKVAPLKTWS